MRIDRKILPKKKKKSCPLCQEDVRGKSSLANIVINDFFPRPRSFFSTLTEYGN